MTLSRLVWIPDGLSLARNAVSCEEGVVAAKVVSTGAKRKF